MIQRTNTMSVILATLFQVNFFKKMLVSNVFSLDFVRRNCRFEILKFLPLEYGMFERNLFRKSKLTR